METITRLINKEEKWLASIAYTIQEASEMCSSKDFRLALIGGGLKHEEESILIQTLNQLRPNLPIVKHYGGGSGLLFAEICQAIDVGR